MKEIFSWPMKINVEGKTEFNTKKVQFDNGYEQNISVGRNNQRQSWNYAYSGDERTVADIEAFVKRHNGVQSFYWTPPDGEQGEYITNGDIAKTAHGGPDGKKLYTIAFEISQVFGADTTDSTASAIISINGKSSPDGKLTLSATDLSADPAGTASKAVTALKQEINPFEQYLLKADVPSVPDIKPLEDQVATLDASLTSLTTTVGEIDGYTQEIHTELEGVSTQVFGLADKVNANQQDISTNKTAIGQLDKSQIKTINSGKPDASGNINVFADEPDDKTTYTGARLKALFEEANRELQQAITSLTKEIKDSGLPLFVTLPFASRNHIPAGFVAADGQDLSAATYPEAATAIKAGQVPVLTDEEWFADPTKRASYTLSADGGRFRLPDYNGMHTDSLGALFFRGDNGQVANGVIQMDAVGTLNVPVATSTQNVAHYIKWFDSKTRLMPAPDFNGKGWNEQADQTGLTALTDRVNTIDLGNKETRPINANVCWAIKLFGEVANTGSADVEQLATDYANLSGRVSGVESKLQENKFTIIYLGGGTAENPVNAEINKRYELINPFPQQPVICQAEVYLNGIWGETGWIYSSGGFGVKASHIVERDVIVVQTGNKAVAHNLNSITGAPHGTAVNSAVNTAPCRVKVWRV